MTEGGFDTASLIALVLCLSLTLGLASTPLFAWADAPPDHAKRRVSTLDGLRGFLAYGVVIYHGAIYRLFSQTGEWRPVSAFSLVLGQAGVSVFFMVTGYLFWQRLVIARGRIDWTRLYISRVFRIGPMFLLASAVAILVSLQGGRHVHIGLTLLAKQIGYYLFIGMLPAVSVRGYDTNLVLAGVTWSLQYEWIFYAILPVLALLTRTARLHLLFAVGLFIIPLAVVWLGLPSGPVSWHPELVCLFGSGALAASLQISGIQLPWPDGAISVVATVLLGIALFGYSNASGPGAILIYALLFYLIATGCSFFGLLRTRAAHRLGHLSYGIYLLQGLALAAVLRPLSKFSAASPVLHLLLLCAACVLLAFMSLAAHHWVEQPGIRLGDRFARWVGARRNPALIPARAEVSKE